MVKYTCCLVACLMVSTSMIVVGSQKDLQNLQKERKKELQAVQQRLQAASISLLKNKGKNLASAEATWNQLEDMQAEFDDIQDQLDDRNQND